MAALAELGTRAALVALLVGDEKAACRGGIAPPEVGALTAPAALQEWDGAAVVRAALPGVAAELPPRATLEI